MVVLILVAAILILVFLITVTQLNAFIALIIAALSVGLMRGMPLKNILESIQQGIGSTLSGLVLILGFGVMLGSVLAESGAINQIADKLIKVFGKKYTNLAVLFTSFIVGSILFYGIGFVILIPLVFSIAVATELPLIYLGITMASALSVTHGFLPPHPGPTAIVQIFKADLGKTLFYGLIIGFPTILIAGGVFPIFLKKIKAHPPEILLETANNSKYADKITYPSFVLSLLISLLPLLLISFATIADFVLPKNTLFFEIIKFIGDPIISILIALLCSFFFLGILTRNKEESWKTRAVFLTDKMNKSASAITMILLIIGAGGAFKQIIESSGMGNELGNILKTLPLSPLFLGWMIATILRILVGSATTASLTAAGIIQPMLINYPNISAELMTLAIGSGSLMCSHINDTGFWMFKEYFGLSLRDTFRTWTVMETLVGICGLTGVLILNIFIH